MSGDKVETFLRYAMKAVMKITGIAIRLVPLIMLVAFFVAIFHTEFIVALAWLGALTLWRLCGRFIRFIAREINDGQVSTPQAA